VVGVDVGIHQAGIGGEEICARGIIGKILELVF
jgi:hypothetical protein